MFQVSFVDAVLVVEKSPLSTDKVEGVHQVGATQVPDGGRGDPWRAEHKQ